MSVSLIDSILTFERLEDVCREFGVARKTGHKTLDRYKVHGLTALSDPSRRPVRSRDRLVRPELVTLVLGTTCYPCLRAGHCLNGGESVRGDRTSLQLWTSQKPLFLWALKKSMASPRVMGHRRIAVRLMGVTMGDLRWETRLKSSPR